MTRGRKKITTEIENKTIEDKKYCLYSNFCKENKRKTNYLCCHFCKEKNCISRCNDSLADCTFRTNISHKDRFPIDPELLTEKKKISSTVDIPKKKNNTLKQITKKTASEIKKEVEAKKTKTNSTEVKRRRGRPPKK